MEWIKYLTDVAPGVAMVIASAWAVVTYLKRPKDNQSPIRDSRLDFLAIVFFLVTVLIIYFFPADSFGQFLK